MDIYILRNNLVKGRSQFFGQIKNTQQNFNYLKDLESWGSAEIIKSDDSYIEYRLI